MAILRRTSDTLELHLPADALIGRGDAYDVQLQHRESSRPHAIVHWSNGRWLLRDLGSSNGTYVGNERLKPGCPKELREGITLSFGTPEEGYQLIDASPPTALARQLCSGRTIAMQDGLLQLPDDSAPQVSIYEERDATTLRIDMPARLGHVIDREVIEVAGTLWQLRTATGPTSNTTHAAMPLCISTMSIDIFADDAWENITLQLSDGAQQVKLKHYSHHELLLILANERAADAAAGKPIDKCGWLTVQQVANRLGSTEASVNSFVHKARSRFRRNNIVPAAAVIERLSGKLRIGIHNITFSGAAKLASKPG